MLLFDMLAARYKFPEWVLLPEVRNGAGFSADRSADALAMNLWPSRGLAIHGFEIKSSRSDWLREKAKPEKAEAFVRFCDYWFVVAEPDCVKLEELPEGWGLMERNGKCLTTRKEAAKLTAEIIPKGVVAAMLKRAVEAAKRPGEKELSAEYERGRSAGAASHNYWEKHLEELQNTVAEFESRSGVSIRSWNAGKVGDAVKLLVDGGCLDRVHRNAEMLHKSIADLEKCLTEIKREPCDT